MGWGRQGAGKGRCSSRDRPKKDDKTADRAYWHHNVLSDCLNDFHCHDFSLNRCSICFIASARCSGVASSWRMFHERMALCLVTKRRGLSGDGGREWWRRFIAWTFRSPLLPRRWRDVSPRMDHSHVTQPHRICRQHALPGGRCLSCLSL